jgi:hypothetical protein
MLTPSQRLNPEAVKSRVMYRSEFSNPMDAPLKKTAASFSSIGSNFTSGLGLLGTAKTGT